MTTRTVPADFGDNREQRGSFELFLLVLQVRKWLSTPKAKLLLIINLDLLTNRSLVQKGLKPVFQI